jgi:GDPmannose 4,6-dehydratase
MWRILQHDTADDFVIATGEARSLESFVSAAFAALDLDWRDHVKVDTALYRPSEILFNKGNPTKAFVQLGWRATFKMFDVVQMMVAAELEAEHALARA